MINEGIKKYKKPIYMTGKTQDTEIHLKQRYLKQQYKPKYQKKSKRTCHMCSSSLEGMPMSHKFCKVHYQQALLND